MGAIYFLRIGSISDSFFPPEHVRRSHIFTVYIEIQ